MEHGQHEKCFGGDVLLSHFKEGDSVLGGGVVSAEEGWRRWGFFDDEFLFDRGYGCGGYGWRGYRWRGYGWRGYGLGHSRYDRLGDWLGDGLDDRLGDGLDNRLLLFKRRDIHFYHRSDNHICRSHYRFHIDILISGSFHGGHGLLCFLG
jgi:hypothetical protein